MPGFLESSNGSSPVAQNGGGRGATPGEGMRGWPPHPTSGSQRRHGAFNVGLTPLHKTGGSSELFRNPVSRFSLAPEAPNSSGTIFSSTVRRTFIPRTRFTIPHILRCGSTMPRYVPLADREAHTGPKNWGEEFELNPSATKAFPRISLDIKSPIRYKKVYLYIECINIL